MRICSFVKFVSLRHTLKWRISFHSQGIRKMASTVNQTRDPNTLSNYNEFVTLITKADLEINFKAKNINGNVTLKLESVSDTETREIILDTSHLGTHCPCHLGSKAEKYNHNS